MNKKKTNIILGIFIALFAVSGIVNIALLIPEAVPLSDKVILTRGTGSGPRFLEPIQSWDSASNDVIEQVVETLYTYDLSDPELPVVPLLAKDMGEWNVDFTEWTIQLQDNVYFHDGKRFNAAAAKWNIDRLLYFLNVTGEAEKICRTHSLYELPNGTSIIKECIVNDDYSITIVLNAVYPPFEDLVCYISMGMLSPNEAYRTTFLDLDDQLIGTGPYEYLYYKADEEVRFKRFWRYWRSNAFFDEMVYTVIKDSQARSQALFAGDIDICSGGIPALYETYISDPGVTFKATENGLSYQYLGFNTRKIDVEWRKAMSYAFDYDYFIDEAMKGYSKRAYSPCEDLFLPDVDQFAEFNPPYLDITVARQVLIDANVTTLDVNDDAGWLDAAENNPLVEFEYTYNTDNIVRSDLYKQLSSDLANIGMRLVDGGLDWNSYLDVMYGDRNALEMYQIGWAPDYIHPFNMIHPMFSNVSDSNTAQVNDPILEDLMAQVIFETDPVAETDLYIEILARISGELYPHLMMGHPDSITIHRVNLKGYEYNRMGTFSAYALYR